MKVYGVEISNEVIDNVSRSMKTMKDGFVAGEVEQWFYANGIQRTTLDGEMVSHRAADRLIQKYRKSGHIKFINRKWYWQDVKD